MRITFHVFVKNNVVTRDHFDILNNIFLEVSRVSFWDWRMANFAEWYRPFATNTTNKYIHFLWYCCAWTLDLRNLLLLQTHSPQGYFQKLTPVLRNMLSICLISGVFVIILLFILLTVYFVYHKCCVFVHKDDVDITTQLFTESFNVSKHIHRINCCCSICFLNFSFKRTKLSYLVGAKQTTYNLTSESTGSMLCVVLNAVCVICLEDFEKTCELVRLQCGHGYHNSCLSKWLLVKRDVIRCPLCGKEIKPRVLSFYDSDSNQWVGFDGKGRKCPLASSVKSFYDSDSTLWHGLGVECNVIQSIGHTSSG